jgi:hypothetical protein
LVEGFRAFTREQAAEAGVALRQGEDEQGGLVANTSHNNLGMSEIALGNAGRVQQGDEDLGVGLFEGGDGVADDAGTARVVVLIAQAFKDASRGVSLLGGREAVVVEDLLDDG